MGFQFSSKTEANIKILPRDVLCLLDYIRYLISFANELPRFCIPFVSFVRTNMNYPEDSSQQRDKINDKRIHSSRSFQRKVYQFYSIRKTFTSQIIPFHFSVKLEIDSLLYSKHKFILEPFGIKW